MKKRNTEIEKYKLREREERPREQTKKGDIEKEKQWKTYIFRQRKEKDWDRELVRNRNKKEDMDWEIETKKILNVHIFEREKQL